MKRKTFKTPANSVPINPDKVYKKGIDNFEIDVDDVRLTLAKLVLHCDTPVDKAPAEYTEIKNAVSVLHGTDYYPVLVSVISEYFKPENVIPGTVKAYMVGCLSNPDPCSSVCAGSAPSTTEVNLCPHKVLISRPEAEKHIFMKVHHAETDKAILFVPYSTLEEFPGFCEEEISNLNKHGVSSVKLIGNNDSLLCDYSSPSSYLRKQRAVNGNVPLSRNEVANVQPAIQQTNSWSNWILWAVIIVIFIGILIYLIWKRSQ